MITHPQKPKGREAIKAWNRMKIIEATVEIVSKHGIAGTTIGRVVELANVSRGLVNVHFKSKKMLLLESAKHMAGFYAKNRESAIQKADEMPEKQIEAIIRSDFSRKVLNQKSAGFWFAFRSQFHSMPEVLPLADTRDASHRKDWMGPIKRINEEGNYNLDPDTIVEGMMSMLEGMWMDFYFYPKNYNRDRAIKTCLLFLSSFFPLHFEKPAI